MSFVIARSFRCFGPLGLINDKMDKKQIQMEQLKKFCSRDILDILTGNRSVQHEIFSRNGQ